MCLTGSRKGVADEQLAKIEEDRKHKAQVDDSPYGLRQRSKSVSSYSTNSVSTISTNMSRSPSPKRPARHRASLDREAPQRTRPMDTSRSRGRILSYMSDTSYDTDRDKLPRGRSQDPRSRRSVHNAHSSGRGRAHDSQRASPGLGSSRKRRRSRSSSLSYTSNSSDSSRQRYRVADDFRRTRPRRSSMSPDVRGRDRPSRAPPPRSSRRTRSRSTSMNRSRIARERRSMTPDHARRAGGAEKPRSRPGFEIGQVGRLEDTDRYGSSFANKENDVRRPSKRTPTSPPRKGRSLSPFSKRLALTQAMNMGR